MPIAWKTLFLPANFPKTQVLRNYVFGHNETHKALVVDYGSVYNHHESANVRAVDFPPGTGINFQVRTAFVCANRNVPKICMYAHLHNR